MKCNDFSLQMEMSHHFREGKEFGLNKYACSDQLSIWFANSTLVTNFVCLFRTCEKNAVLILKSLKENL